MKWLLLSIGITVLAWFALSKPIEKAPIADLPINIQYFMEKPEEKNEEQVEQTAPATQTPTPDIIGS